MSPAPLYVDGKPLRIGRRIGKGGEGEVYLLDEDPARVVKIYTTHDKAQRESKIAAMVSEGLAKRAPLVAFPLSITRTADGRFAGFVMQLVGNHKPLHELYSPGPRKIHFAQADYRFLVRTAANIARAIASVHQSGCVIGDINHSGILVSPRATVALIDADSFQISTGGQTYRCVVGVPEYTAPELQGQSLKSVVRTPNHDAFGLAVVVFQLLFMGRHPFVGSVRQGELPPLHEAIRDFRYVYDDRRNVGMDQPPGTPALDRFFPPIASAFDEAFGREFRDRRPTAERWVELLSAMERSLVECDENPLHFIPQDADDCAWCEMERHTGSSLFLPYAPTINLVQADFDPGAHGFDLGALWARVDAIVIPSLPPDAATSSLAPSQGAERARSLNKGAIFIRLFAVVAGFGLTAALPAAWPLWLGIGAWIWIANPTEFVIDRAKFEGSYLAAQRACARAREEWEKRAGIVDCVALRRQLEQARDSYRGLAAEEAEQVEAYRAQRRVRQLHAHLDNFSIRQARIKGIGPAKLAALSSFGLDTAADVEETKVLSVPGFGPVTSKPLLDWRATLERHFVYREQQTDTDLRELGRIRAAIEARAASLRKTLIAGQANLEKLAARARHVLATEDAGVARARLGRDQATSDLRFLGLAVPQLPASPSVPPPPWGPAPRTPATAGAPSCPRCGSTMIKRTARRGLNAGGQFWGCRRYPRCKGTRNI